MRDKSEDPWIEELWEQCQQELPDHGFSQQTIRKIGRMQQQRRWILLGVLLGSLGILIWLFQGAAIAPSMFELFAPANADDLGPALAVWLSLLGLLLIWQSETVSFH
ncbi:hypothetical protein [Pseudobacteriovorax antillogorgiicola]|uniref:DUF5056 domain-containing protein n=1 Tax=Pseudobacteriovorax antillogorgiicola TaxID=1513793 RepID=A0A1Y6CQY5_9BACT|nr:hypothetical protein [Pseudobacteriovorax antillogorgiicola]TCS42222.1 hypothetical protein EDD56_14319 [Pseudobacteriovorax antillogorgiicola]SMF82765.1 hypothetical protein SAMN06296036_1438 [Pseudobacteriovorax antillogorgiicola]